MSKRKFLSLFLVLALLVGICPAKLSPMAADISLPEGTIYVSNLYGSDSNGGETQATAVKTLKKAIELIGTSNDGTVCVLDGKDQNGNREYEVYTRNSKTPYIYGEQNIVQYANIPAHTGTITYIGDASDSVICFGPDNLELKGPSIFKNITLLEGWKRYKSFYTLGHSVTFDSDVHYITTAPNDTNNPKVANVGLEDPGRHNHEIYIAYTESISTTVPARITLKNANVDFVAISSYDGNFTIANNQTVHVCEGANVGYIQLRNAKGSWNMQDINVVVDGGQIGEIADKATGTATANAVQIVMNNGVSAPYTKTGITLSKGEWIMRAAKNSTGAKLDVTETAGTFEVIGGLTAIAQNKDGDVYISENGFLTVPAGEYNVSFHAALGANDMLVSFDGNVDDQAYTRGEQITLPELDDKFGASFMGWTIDGTQYAAGDKYTLPTDKILINFTSVWDTTNASATVYIDAENGSDTNDGLSSETAFATLTKAIQFVDAAPGNKKFINIIGTLKVDSIPAYTNEITFTGGQFYIYKDSVAVGGPTKFQNIEIYSDVSSKFLETQEHPITIGANVVCNNTTSATGIPMHIGTPNSDGGKETLEINSGTFGPVLVGSYYNTDSNHSTEGAQVTVNGGTISEIRLGADGWLTQHMGSIFTQDVNITVNGGSVEKITRAPGNRAPTFNAALQIILNNGIRATVPESCETADGYWLMKGESKSGSYLSPTATEGQFAVAGSLTAVAQGSDGVQYVSASGILTVPAGVYNVTYTDTIYYINNGSKVEFYQDYEIDVENLRYTAIENKLFIGWAYEDGSGVKTNSFKNGDKLYAKYVDCDLSAGGDFTVKGAEIRMSSSSGLRFIIEKSDALSNALGDIEYGAVAIPTLYMGADTLELGSTYTYYEENYEAKSVKGTNTFDKTANGIEYTACITGIAQENYRRTYTVRGYIKYTNLQGNEKILYTNTYATSLYTVASEALEQGNLTNMEKLISKL